MSARLTAELRQSAVGLAERASAYRMAGERELAGLAKAAADRCGDAAEAIGELERAQAEARRREDA